MEFDEFADEYLFKLTRFVGVLTGDRQAAHDLTVDVLLKLSNKWWLVRDVRDPLAYVQKALVRHYLDDRRQQQARIRRDVRAAQSVPVSAADASSQIAERDLVDRALAALPPQQRGALVLRYYLDLPDLQIAGLLGCSVSTVRSHLSLAAAKLRGDNSLLRERE
ncbi:sigma-70 family RNA polymerase sigma factor [Nakamurella silvestris]|nr:sigma-70 family RNA polymerase sigma factor [Nakamurella silvestris]